MILDHTSWHARLNTYMYGAEDTLKTTNLCPYFWGIVGAVLGFIPTVIFKTAKYQVPEAYRQLVGSGLIIFSVAGLIVWGFITDAGATLGILTLIGVVSVVVIGCIYLAMFIIEWSGINTERSISINMFKGWKDKHCPRIEWV